MLHFKINLCYEGETTTTPFCTKKAKVVELKQSLLANREIA